MDLREQIIQKIMQALDGRTDAGTADIVQDILIIELNNYEIQERCTDVALADDSADRMLKKFLATKRIEGIAESTLLRYAEENKKLIRFLGKPLYEVSTYDIRFYLSYRRENSGKKLGNRTLDGMRRCYSSFFSWLSAEGLIGRNPCAAIKQIKYRKEVKKPYSAAEMEKLRRACANKRDLALLDFLYCTGCRVSEVARLNIDDIDFENMECTVLGKGNKERTVYLSEVAAMNLGEYLASREDNNEALFTGKGTERLGKNGIEVLLKRIGRKAGVINVHPHRYRRTLATNLLDRGMNIQDVAVILGHADLKTTQVYCYISQKNVKNAYSKYAT
ncbi:MAG: tyrosine-type recombinase/integrase [Lachnospiraceae bacterium]|mgnify:CR=1 FL=1|jgi:site-specific recombinase XerD|nr:tyrosine-type recombinase/integrase [Lachnospiraceae bacterium]